MFDARIRLETLFLPVLAAAVLAGCGTDDPTSPGPAASGPRIEGAGGAGGAVVVEALDVVPDDTPVRVTPAYRLGPGPIDFPTTGALRLPVTQATLDSLERPEDLIGGVFANGAWYGIPESSFDPESGELVIPIDYVGPAELDSATVDTTEFARRTGAVIQFVSGGRSGGDLFAGLRPVYVSLVGGSDVAACGSTAQPCRTLTFALAKASRGEKVVLQGPGAFSDALGVVDLPPNGRIEGRNGASLVDVTLRAAIPGARPAVRNLAIEESGGVANGGNRFALLVSAGVATFENISSRSTRGLRVTGGQILMRGGSWRDKATFFDLDRGDRDHEFDNLTIRDAPSAAIVVQRDARAVFRSCTFRDNDTAIFVPYFGHVTVTGCTFRSNGRGLVVGEYPSTLLDPVTATATIQNNTFRGNTVAGVLLQTPAWQNCIIEGVRDGRNTWDNDPPILWNGPGPWVGRPDVANILAPLGPARWWPIPGTAPSARIGAAMGWDEDLGRVILFGGLNETGVALDDTWSFDPTTDTWQQESVLLGPSARTEHAIASAPASQRLFLFGGRDNAPTPSVYDDLYLFDSAVSDWIPLSPSTTAQGRLPGARYGANFEHVGGDRFLLYGGIGPGGGTYAEWWIYDAAANEWSDLTNPVGIPAERFRAFAAGGASGSDAWFYGGTDANGALNGVLGHYNATTGAWTEGVFPANGPQPMAYASFEAVQTGSGPRQLLLFGGLRNGGTATDFLDATFAFGNLAGPLVGSQVADGLTDVRPEARARHASVSFRRDRHTVCLIFGGADDIASLRNDTWIWAPGGISR